MAAPPVSPAAFGTITVTDHQTGFIDIAIALNNGNFFSGGGFPLAFGFNLFVGNPIITYSNLSIGFSIAGNLDPQQAAGTYHQDGFGTFQYGVDFLIVAGRAVPVRRRST